MLQQQIRKTCFEKCFPSTYPDQLAKDNQICLAKCMDRMIEAHSIVVFFSMSLSIKYLYSFDSTVYARLRK